MPGIVALDLTTALFSDFCVNTSHPESAKDLVALRLSSFVEHQSHHLRAECRDAPVIGIIVSAYAPALIYNTPVATVYTAKVWSAVHLAEAGETESAWFLSFVDAAHGAAFRQQAPDA